MTPLQALNRAIEIVADGKVGEFATQIGVGQSVVSNWRARMASAPAGRAVPAEHCPEIEQLTDGRIRCEHLNPHVNWGLVRSRAKRNRASAPSNV